MSFYPLISCTNIDRTNFSAHSASVPISVHLDHATDPEHLDLALSLAEQGIAFDSIMVDASHADVCLVTSSSGSQCPPDHGYLIV